MLFKFLENKIEQLFKFSYIFFYVYIKTNRPILFLILLNEHNFHMSKNKKKLKCIKRCQIHDVISRQTNHQQYTITQDE